MASTKLYPPRIATYTPAFILGQDCTVTYSITDYNNISDISFIQVSVINQYTNESVLRLSKYPAGIMMIKFNGIAGCTSYSFDITPADFIDDIDINQYYKIQIRLVQNNSDQTGLLLDKVEAITEYDYYFVTETYIQNYLDFFSEWSTVSLVRPISTPSLTITGADDIVYDCFLRVSAQLIFQDSRETQNLKTYKCDLYYYDQLVQTTGIINVSNYRSKQFQHDFDYYLSPGQSYFLSITYQTQNGYTNTETKIIKSIYNDDSDPTLTISYQPDDVNGCMIVTLKDNTSNPDESTSRQIYIKRASSQTNFDYWNDIHLIKFYPKENSTYSWRDYTVQQGIYYKYATQQRLVNNNIITYKTQRGTDLALVDFEDFFLINETGRLRIRYNPTITNFKYIVQQSVTNTLGGVYPVVRRNGDTLYQQFSISGYITGAQDIIYNFTQGSNIYNDKQDIIGKYIGTLESAYIGDIFITAQQLFDSLYSTYAQYSFDKRRVIGYNDIAFERLLRKKVMKYLMDNKPKLFKSDTQGNIIVKLVNVTFEPQKGLGRSIYKFTAQANQIAEDTVQNYDKYNIATLKLCNPKYKYILREIQYNNVEYYVKMLKDKYIIWPSSGNKYMILIQVPMGYQEDEN